MRLVKQRIVTIDDGSDVKVNYFDERVVQLLLNSVTDKSSIWLRTSDGRFSVVFSLSNASIAKNKTGDVIGLTVYPYITQNYFNGKLRKVLQTPIKDYTEIKIKQATENFNDHFEHIAHAGLSSKQTGKSGEPYEGRRCFVTVYFDMDEIVRELEKNGVNILEDYSPTDVISDVFPVFYLFLNKVRSAVVSLVDYIGEETKMKVAQDSKKVSPSLFDIGSSTNSKESER